jgi:hypothetical protein
MSNRRSLDVEPHVAAVGQSPEAPIAAVRDDRPDARETGQAVAQELTTGPDVVWLGGISASAHGQAQDLDEDRSFGADRPTAPTAGVVKRRAIAPAPYRFNDSSSATRPRIEHGGSGCRLELDRLGSTSQGQHSPSEADPQDEHRRHRGRDQQVAAYEVNECVGAGDGPANGTGNEQERARHPGPLASIE